MVIAFILDLLSLLIHSCFNFLHSHIYFFLVYSRIKVAQLLCADIEFSGGSPYVAFGGTQKIFTNIFKFSVKLFRNASPFC
jgi:hypothetical protein